MNSEKLSKSAQAIQDALENFGVSMKVIELADSTRTADDAAKAIGCEVAQIVKSLIFKTKETGKPILVLASGINRVDEKLIAQEVGEKIVKADANFVRDVTGFAIGGIPPLGHTQKIDTYIDQDLLKYSELWTAAGTPNAVFKLNSKDLISLTNGKIIPVI